MYHRILVPLDLTEPALCDQALNVAERLAKTYGAEMHAVTVVPDYSMTIVGSFFPEGHEKAALDAAKSAMSALLSGRKAAPAIKGHIAHGTIYDEIMNAANTLACDLIVIASHRPEFRDYLLGPNAARVVRHARQSVFVVRGQE